MSEVDYAENYMEQDDYSDNESSEGNDLKGADKRAHHNALERKRRDHIKDSFSGLRDAIPLLHGEKINSHKASRAQILKKAAEYIDHMRRKNNDHQKDIDVLKRDNKLLEEKIRALEELKCAGQLKNSNNKATQQAANTRNSSKSLIVSSANNGSSNGSTSTNGSSSTSSAATTSNGSNSSANSDGTSLLQTRVKSESVSLEDDSENLLDNTSVQIVKKANVVTNGKLNSASGTTLLVNVPVNGTIIKQANPPPIHHQSGSLLGPPNKRTKRLIIAANTSIISK